MILINGIGIRDFWIRTVCVDDCGSVCVYGLYVIQCSRTIVGRLLFLISELCFCWYVYVIVRVSFSSSHYVSKFVGHFCWLNPSSFHWVDHRWLLFSCVTFRQRFICSQICWPLYVLFSTVNSSHWKRGRFLMHAVFSFSFDFVLCISFIIS